MRICPISTQNYKDADIVLFVPQVGRRPSLQDVERYGLKNVFNVGESLITAVGARQRPNCPLAAQIRRLVRNA